MIVWSELLSNVLQAVLLIMLPPLIVSGVRWVWAQGSVLWEKVKASRPTLAEILEQGARFAVKAAEQAGLAGLIEDKKDYAIEIAEKWLLAQKMTVDLDLVDAAIEKAVAELFPAKG